nr:hypothetical protein [Tanacetum cinerariifolium]
MTDFLAVGALGCTLSIMVIVALREQRFRSFVRFLLSRPYRISLNHILFLEKLLLILVVVIEFSLVLSLSFRISTEFPIHLVVGQLDSKIKSLGSCRHDISMNVIGKSIDVPVDLLGLIRKEFSAHQGCIGLLGPPPEFCLHRPGHDSSKLKKNRVSMVLRVVLQKMKCCELLH